MSAASGDFLDVVKWLVQNGANVSDKVRNPSKES
jgi:hypothetical protein